MKKMLCTALAAALTLGMLSGCGQEQDPGASKKPGNAVPMGRYIEEPGETLEDVNRVLGLHRAENGDIVFYVRQTDSQGGDSLEQCVLPAGGGVLVRTEQTWAAALGKVRDLSEAPDGTLYVLTYGENYADRVCRVVDGGVEDIAIPDLVKSDGQAGSSSGSVSVGGVSVGSSVALEDDEDGGEAADGQAPIISFGGDSGEDPDQFDVTPKAGVEGETGDGAGGDGGAMGSYTFDGSSFSAQESTRYLSGIRALPDGEFLLIFGSDAVCRYGIDGKLRMEYPSAGYNEQVRVWNGQLVTAGPVEKSVVVYDLASGAKVAESTYDALDFNACLGLDDQGIYLADSTGIYRQNVGGSVWERLVDGELTSLTMPTWSVSGICADGEGFYVMLTGESSAQLMHYVYDENTPTLPDQELVIFGLTDNNTIRQAIGEFQRRNPTVRVNFQVMLDEDSGATAEDVIRALNTELVAGKGPDLLLLDGLPVDSYMEKGVLADLTDQLKALVDGQGLLENLTRAYERDGKVYGVPARFTVPVMMGKKEDVDRILSLSDLAHAVEAGQGGQPQFLWPSEELYEDGGMLMEYYNACAGNLVGRSGVDQAGLADYLSQMLRIQNTEKVYTPELGDNMMFSIVVSTGGSSGFELLDNGAMSLRQGKALFHIQELVGTMGLQNILTNLSDGSWALDTLFGGSSYTPVGSVGIVSSTQQPDLARSFLDLLLSPAVQDYYLYDGFPVNGASLDRLVGEAKEEASGDDMGFRALCDRLDTPVLIDQVVREAVEAQAKALAEGNVTPEQAAANVVDKTKIYLAE